MFDCRRHIITITEIETDTGVELYSTDGITTGVTFIPRDFLDDYPDTAIPLSRSELAREWRRRFNKGKGLVNEPKNIKS